MTNRFEARRTFITENKASDTFLRVARKNGFSHEDVVVVNRMRGIIADFLNSGIQYLGATNVCTSFARGTFAIIGVPKMFENRKKLLQAISDSDVPIRWMPGLKIHGIEKMYLYGVQVNNKKQK